ncbi:MAG: cobalt-precorrin 5A hydrolase [Halobacteria archaeon]|nr:cobalt-precorrin 5A hydrolase [Halobacteria archaeon]
MSSDPDSEGEVAKDVAIISFERKMETAEDVKQGIESEYETVDVVEYHSDVFEENWRDYDAFIGLMASGIAVRKIAPLLESKWDDPGIVVTDEELTWAIPITGGHHGANQVAKDLEKLGAVPTMTTASEVAGKQSVESKAKALDAHVVNGDSTVKTNLAVLNDELDAVERLEGPRAVLVGDDVTVLKRNKDENEGVVVGVGAVSDVETDDVKDAVETALGEIGRDVEDIEFIATATKKEDEEGILEAARQLDVGVVTFDKETLQSHVGPSDSRAEDLVGWPGVAESSALAGSRQRQLVLEKNAYHKAVTVAVAE